MILYVHVNDSVCARFSQTPQLLLWYSFSTRVYSVDTCPHTGNKENIVLRAPQQAPRWSWWRGQLVPEESFGMSHERPSQMQAWFENQLFQAYLRTHMSWDDISFYCDEQKGHCILIQVGVQPRVIWYKYLNHLLKPLELWQAYEYRRFLRKPKTIEILLIKHKSTSRTVPSTTSSHQGNERTSRTPHTCYSLPRLSSIIQRSGTCRRLWANVHVHRKPWMRYPREHQTRRSQIMVVEIFNWFLPFVSCISVIEKQFGRVSWRVVTELEENSGGRQTPPSHLCSLLFSQKVRSVIKSRNGIYAADLGAVKVLVGKGRKQNEIKQKIKKNRITNLCSFFDVRRI